MEPNYLDDEESEVKEEIVDVDPKIYNPVYDGIDDWWEYEEADMDERVEEGWY